MAFGPGSLLYESYGDRIGYLVAPRAGLLQLMYPDLGRGVEQHSAFYTEPWERLFRSVPQIVGTIFDGDHAQGTADQVREYHRDIKGSHDDGSRYHALDPDTYFWAHATFVDAAFTTNSLFKLNPLDLYERRAYYLECIEWWQMYGLSMRPVPADVRRLPRLLEPHARRRPGADAVCREARGDDAPSHRHGAALAPGPGVEGRRDRRHAAVHVGHHGHPAAASARDVRTAVDQSGRRRVRGVPTRRRRRLGRAPRPADPAPPRPGGLRRTGRTGLPAARRALPQRQRISA